MMNLREAILTRRTVHSYVHEGVPPELLTNAIECAVHAPNHRLTMPWRFYRLGPKSRETVAELQIEMKNLTGAAAHAMREKMCKEGELLVVAIARPRPAEGVSTQKLAEIENEDYASLACAIQNMSLYLWSEGYGSKWSTGAVTKHEKIYEILNQNSDDANLSPETLRLCGFFWIGRIAGRAPSAAKRPDVEDVFKHLP